MTITPATFGGTESYSVAGVGVNPVDSEMCAAMCDVSGGISVPWNVNPVMSSATVPSRDEMSCSRNCGCGGGSVSRAIVISAGTDHAPYTPLVERARTRHCHTESISNGDIDAGDSSTCCIACQPPRLCGAMCRCPSWYDSISMVRPCVSSVTGDHDRFT